jgi:hypothetical protein
LLANPPLPPVPPSSNPFHSNNNAMDTTWFFSLLFCIAQLYLEGHQSFLTETVFSLFFVVVILVLFFIFYSVGIFIFILLDFLFCCFL